MSYTPISFTPFDPLPASDMNVLAANDASFNDGTGIADNAITPAKLTGHNYQTDNSNSIANVLNGDLKYQSGWGQIASPGASIITEAITFPAAFTTPLGIVGSYLARPTTPTAAASSVTGLTSFPGGGTQVSIAFEDLTTTGAVVHIQSSVSLSSGDYQGYSWHAWGL